MERLIPVPGRPRNPTAAVATAIGGGLLGLMWLSVFGGLTIDDAFITWRYAINLVDHGIWNYNPSYIDLVEAYTNPSFAFLAIIPAALGISIEVFFKFFMGALGIVFLVWMWRRPIPAWQRIGLLVLTIANPIMHVHWWSGLETGLWIMVMTLVFTRMWERGELGWAGYGGLLLLALTRPEGLGYLAVLVVWQLLLKRTARQWLQTGVLLVVLGGYWVARTLYFGRLLPNTFYAKTAGHAKTTGLAFGAVIMVLICVLVPVLVMIAVDRSPVRLGERIRRVVVPYRPGGGDAVERARWTPVLMAVLAVGIQFVVYANSSLQMDYANRFAFQLVLPVLLVCLSLPLTGRRRVPAAVALVMMAVVVGVIQASRMNGVPLVLAMAGLGLAVAAVATKRGRATVAATVLLAISVSLIPFQDALWMAIYRPRLQSTHVPVGKVLANYNAPGNVMVVHDAGVVPYESGWETIDVYGLATRRITDQEMTVEDLAEINPEVVIANRFLAKSYLNKYGDRYDKVPNTTIHVLKTFDPGLKRDLEAEIAKDLEERKLDRVQILLQRWPGLDWFTGGTR
ncbi:hypothetical protein ACQBAU_05505 [Propionibacteriaceae bacterium Y2011]